MSEYLSAFPIRIIGIGNRYFGDDEVGPRVYDALAQRPLPAGVLAIDGGLRGLDLLGSVEGAQRVIFVDTLNGFGRPGEVVLISRPLDIEEQATAYGHGGGLVFLLRALKATCEGKLPEIFVVGVEGRADERAVEALAGLCMELASGREFAIHVAAD